jgi:hypothetical protein
MKAIDARISYYLRESNEHFAQVVRQDKTPRKRRHARLVMYKVALNKRCEEYKMGAWSE